MKLSKHFHETATSLTMQKRLIYVLVALLSVMVVALQYLSGKNSVVIERDAYGISVGAQVGNSEPTDAEIKVFLPLAMAERFDSEAQSAAFISEDEQLIRAKEVVELKQRDIWQKILVEEIAVNGSVAKVKILRIVRLGELASAIPAEIEVKLVRVNRSRSNPFGLKAFGFVLAEASKDLKNKSDGGGK